MLRKRLQALPSEGPVLQRDDPDYHAQSSWMLPLPKVDGMKPWKLVIRLTNPSSDAGSILVTRDSEPVELEPQ